MKLFSKKNEDNTVPVVQTTSKGMFHPYGELYHTGIVSQQEYRLYRTLREAVPVIDAAIGKIVRLTGKFRVKCERKSVEKKLRDFLE